MEKESNMIGGYQTAYNNACAALREKNPEDICANTGAVFIERTGSLQVQYLHADYLVDCASGDVARALGDAPTATTVKVLILHYLLHAVKHLPTGKMISFRDVRGGGANYYPTFNKRAILPLQKTFENDTDKLIQAGLRLKGTQAAYGDASVTLPIFPHVPVTYVIWQGDEEISSSASILFDANVNSYLPCEDIVLAASFGAYELMKVAGSL